jgi:hypothetical protein
MGPGFVCKVRISSWWSCRKIAGSRNYYIKELQQEHMYMKMNLLQQALKEEIWPLPTTLLFF